MFNFTDHLNCAFHNSHVFTLMKKFALREKTCTILGCTRKYYRLMKLLEDKDSLQYGAIGDSYACIMSTMTHRRLEIRTMNDEGIDIEFIRNKPILPSHMWRLSRGMQEGNRVIRPAVEHGICNLGTLMERQTLMWVRQSILRKDVLVSGNVIFLSYVYKYYCNMCEQSCKKPKTEHYVLAKIAEAR